MDIPVYTDLDGAGFKRTGRGGGAPRQDRNDCNDPHNCEQRILDPAMTYNTRRHCEERSDEAIQGDRTGGCAAALDCFAARAARNDGSSLRDAAQSGDGFLQYPYWADRSSSSMRMESGPWTNAILRPGRGELGSIRNCAPFARKFAAATSRF
jgi:hypothetical protein